MEKIENLIELSQKVRVKLRVLESESIREIVKRANSNKMRENWNI